MSFVLVDEIVGTVSLQLCQKNKVMNLVGLEEHQIFNVAFLKKDRMEKFFIL